MTPEIFHGVGDYRRRQPGPRARGAERAGRRSSFKAGVHFMAETSKVLSPEKTVLIPRPARRLLPGRLDHRRRRPPDASQRYPGVPVVTYVNTTAAVKAETDICCTSANAVQRRRGRRRRVGRDGHHDARTSSSPQRRARRPTCKHHRLGRAAARSTSASPRAEIREPARPNPDVVVLAHPECPTEVLRSLRFRRLHGGDDRLRHDAQAAAGRADHRMLHGRQRRRASARHASSCGPATSART